MPVKVAFFTDTLDEMNGVSRFLLDVSRLAHEAGHEVRIVTSSREVRHELPYRVNFRPRLRMRLPYYPDVPLVLPPFGAIAKWAAEFQPDVIEVSTPGIMGIAGLRAARRLRVPAMGVYHTDFPAFVKDITGSAVLSRSAQLYMRFFYGRLKGVFSRTQQYVPALVELGIPQERVHLTLPFVDRRKFSPAAGDQKLWREMQVREKYKLLYCGRVSREKNLPLLAEVFAHLAELRTDTALIVAGYGPYLKDLQERLKGLPVYYLGRLSDSELSRLYASSDLYVFPSLTDTLGQVVLESQACGTPVLVSDVGGPKEVVEDGVTGMVLPGDDAAAWVRAISTLLDDGRKRGAMRRATQALVQRFGEKRAVGDLWDRFEEAAAAEVAGRLLPEA